MNTRFQPGDKVSHADRPAVVRIVQDHDGVTRYGIEYTDAEGGIAGFPKGLLGRVLQAAQ